MRAEIETGADKQTTRHVAVRGLIHLDARELHVFSAGLQGVRAESVGVLRRPLQTAIALEIPAVVRREHRQPKTGEDLLLLRDTKPALQRRNARRLRIASEECHVAVQSTGEARCRLRSDGGRHDQEAIAPLFRGRSLRWHLVAMTEVFPEVADICRRSCARFLLRAQRHSGHEAGGKRHPDDECGTHPMYYDIPAGSFPRKCWRQDVCKGLRQDGKSWDVIMRTMSGITRRQLLGSLSAAYVAQPFAHVAKPFRAARTAQTAGGSPPIRVRTLNHFGLAVTDPKRSLDFYQGLFGMPVQARGRHDDDPSSRRGTAVHLHRPSSSERGAQHQPLLPRHRELRRRSRARRARGARRDEGRRGRPNESGRHPCAPQTRSAVRRSGWDRVSAAGRQLLRWIRPARERVPDCRAVAKQGSACAPRSESLHHFFERRRTFEHVLSGSVRPLDSLVPGSDRAHAGDRSNGGSS